ncbi:MBL fold hydrolase, partial [Candidatus Bathyarchaeota archaeon CG07_land_8_20_14_0_80_47_9]
MSYHHFNETEQVGDVKMSWQNIAKLSEGVYWVGVRDWNRRLFDALIALPHGTTYNSYLVIGKAKKTLIDTVNPGFEKEWEEKIRNIADMGEIDYLIMNHAEPDHAGAIPYFMSMNNKANLITTEKGAKLAQTFYKVPSERIQIVHDQEMVDLGGKTLQFIEAPM